MNCISIGRFPWVPVAATCFLACLVAWGCGSKRDPLDSVVPTDSPINFQMWLADESQELSPDQFSLLQEALQELRFKVMAESTPPSSEAVEQALFGAIDGKTARVVILRGFKHEVERLKQERGALSSADFNNQLMRTRPGDHASEDYLAGVQRRVKERIAESGQAIARAEKVVAEFSPAN